MATLLSNTFVGRLNLVRLDGRDIQVKGGDAAKAGGFSKAFSHAAKDKNGGSEKSISMREIRGQIDKELAAAMGFQRGYLNKGAMTSNQAAGVMTLRGAMAVMNIAESDKIRLGFSAKPTRSNGK